MKHNTIWILVAHESGARLFESNGPGQIIKLLEEIANPSGRLQNKEIDTDRPGRTFATVGQHRHAFSPHQAAHEHVVEKFAKDLVILLTKKKSQQKYNELILVAGPSMLGELATSIKRKPNLKIIATMNKDLGNVPTSALPKFVGNLIRELWADPRRNESVSF